MAEAEAIRTKLDDGWRATIGVIFAVFLLTAIGGVQTGTSWDENEHRRYGHAVLSFYSSFGADRTATTDWMGYYGALYTTVATIAEKVLPFSHWAYARHLVSAAFGAAALFWTARLGRLLAGKWAGVAAAAMLALMPRFVGDAMFNPIDIPTASLYIAGVYYLARLAIEGHAAPRSLWAKAGIAIGLTLAVRSAGLLLLFYLGLLCVALTIPAIKERVAKIAGGFSIAIACAWISAAIFWPKFMLAPIGTIRDVLLVTSSFPWTGAVFFRGTYHAALDIPWTYLPVWLSITMPLPAIAGLACAIAFWKEWATPRLAIGVVVLSALFAPLYAVVTNATVYDGIRHFLFVLPPLAALAGCGAVAAWNAAMEPQRRRFVLAGFLLLAAEPLWWYARSHPYEYVYFNPGVSDPSRRYDGDYWGLSMREASEWLGENRIALAGTGQVLVLTNTSWQLLEPWFDDPSRYVHVKQTNEPFHVYLESARARPPGWDQHGRPAYSFTPIAGRAPFWRVHIGPAVRR